MSKSTCINQKRKKLGRNRVGKERQKEKLERNRAEKERKIERKTSKK